MPQNNINTKEVEKGSFLPLKMKQNYKKQPSKYMGIDKNCTWLISLLQKHSGLKDENIILTLLKIKTDESFECFENQLCISESELNNIFKETIKIISPILKSLIFCPTSFQVKEASLLIPLDINCINIYIIINTFEIEIQKPSDPVHQTLTLSRWLKDKHTIKYLIGCTPDGFISVISKGYGGAISDMSLLEQSPLLEHLPENSVVMAERDLKHVESFFINHKCTLIGPSNLFGYSEKMPLDKIIRRIREYKMLRLFSTLDLNYLGCIDDIVTTVCSLINLSPN